MPILPVLASGPFAVALGDNCPARTAVFPDRERGLRKDGGGGGGGGGPLSCESEDSGRRGGDGVGEVSSVGSSLVLGTEAVDEVAERVREAFGSFEERRRREEVVKTRGCCWGGADFSAWRRRVKFRRILPGPAEDIAFGKPGEEAEGEEEGPRSCGRG